MTSLPPWTGEQLLMLRSEYGITPNDELAARIGRSKPAIVQKARDLRIGRSREPYRRWSPEMTALLSNLYQTTEAKEIAEILGVTLAVIKDRVKRLGLKKIRRAPKGNTVDENSRSKTARFNFREQDFGRHVDGIESIAKSGSSTSDRSIHCGKNISPIEDRRGESQQQRTLGTKDIYSTQSRTSKLQTGRRDRVGGSERSAPRGNDFNSYGLQDAQSSKQFGTRSNRRSCSVVRQRAHVARDENDHRPQVSDIKTDESAGKANGFEMTVASLRKALQALKNRSRSISLERARVIADSTNLLAELAKQELQSKQG